MIKRILFAAMLLAMLPLASCGNKKTAETSQEPQKEEVSTEPQKEEASTEPQIEEASTSMTSGVVPSDSLKKMKKVKFETTLGDFTVALYDDTPLHRDNMVKLANEHYYDGLLFHRVIKDFMVQGGDPDSKNAKPGQMLGSGDPGYTVPAEIRPNHFHTRYALAAARTGDQVNPERRSSGSQFYVVTGSKFSPQDLSNMAEQMAFNQLVQDNMDRIVKMQEAQDMAGLQALQTEFEAKAKEMAPDMIPADVADKYATVGGAPHLDGQYTVYGEVIDGFKTIDAIEQVKTGTADRPVTDVRINKAYVVE